MDPKIVISIKEYREFMNDQISSDKKILAGIQYLQAFCRNIIKIELEKTDKNK